MHSASSLSIQQLVKDELLVAVRRRRSSQQERERQDTSEDTDEDLGLPRSPCNSPPTTADVLLDKTLKENPNKSHSTCSDGSLLSMGSSEMDEDSMGQNSGHSSKLSLHDKKAFQDNDTELDIGVSAAPLSHSAARHKMSVRPKRTHGAPRRHRQQLIAAGSSLPTTPEVNEEASGRSISPEAKLRKEVTTESSKSDDSEPPAWPPPAIDCTLPSSVNLPIEIQQKSASLPPGLALTPGENLSKLPRSRSNAAYRQIEPPAVYRYKRAASASELEMNMSSVIALEALTKSREMFGVVGEEDEEEKADTIDNKNENNEKDEKKEESTFFSRLLSRRSGKKKKEKMEETDSIIGANTNRQTILPPLIAKNVDEIGQYGNEFSSEMSSHLVSKHYTARGQSRSSAALRQRVEPINLPPSPEMEKRDTNVVRSSANTTVLAPESHVDVSLTDRDETRTRETMHHTRMPVPVSHSSSKHKWQGQQPERIKEQAISNKSNFDNDKRSDVSTTPQDNNSQYKSKFQIGGILHQEMQPLENASESDEREYSSLIHTSDEYDAQKYPVKKSHSFRTDIEYVPKLPKTPAKNSMPLPATSNELQESSFQEDVREIEETTISYKSTISAKISGDSVILPKNEIGSSHKDTFIQNEHLAYGSEPLIEEKSSLFTNNVYVSTRSVLKEKTIENILTEIPVSNVVPDSENEAQIEKVPLTDSVDNITNLEQNKIQSKNVSSVDSSSSYTQQVIVPVGTEGITITQTVRRHEDNDSELKESVTIDVQSQNLHPVDQQVTISDTDFINDTDINVAVKPIINEQEATDNHIVSENGSLQDTQKTIEYTKKLVDPLIINSEKQDKEMQPQNPNPATSRPQPLKRETRQLTPSLDQVPEFLRIQLNRVDSQPALNVVFDTDKTEQQRIRLKSVEEKPEEKTDSIDLNTVPVNKETMTSEISPPATTTSMPVKQRLFKEEHGKVFRDNIDSLSNSAKLPIQPCDGVQKVQNINSFLGDQNKGQTVASKTKRSISLVSTPAQQNHNCSVISISSELQTAQQSKFPIKKQSSSFDSPETQLFASDIQNLNETGNIKSVSKVDGIMAAKDTVFNEVVIRKKSIQREFMFRKDEENSSVVERTSSGRESVSSEASSIDIGSRNSKSKEYFGSESSNVESGTNEVVLRKKPTTKEIGQKKEEEPELLKVFARRSLKLKDSDTEIIGQQNITPKIRDNQPVSEVQVAKSRDSDKENECGDSPKEERKKQPTKEPLGESKVHIDIATEMPMKTSTIGVTVNNNNTRNSSPASFKYQRSISGGSTASNENGTLNENILLAYKKDNNISPDKRIRNRTVPESPRTDSNLISSDKNSHRAWASKYKEKDTHLTCTEGKPSIDRLNTQTDGQTNASEKEESNIPRFKRIQQRREEWEQRAQLASKKTLP